MTSLSYSTGKYTSSLDRFTWTSLISLLGRLLSPHLFVPSTERSLILHVCNQLTCVFCVQASQMKQETVQTADVHIVGWRLIGGISVVCSNRCSSMFIKSSCSHRLRDGKGYSHTQSRDKKLVNMSIMVKAQFYCVMFVGSHTHNGPIVTQHDCMAGASTVPIHEGLRFEC